MGRKSGRFMAGRSCINSSARPLGWMTPGLRSLRIRKIVRRVWNPLEHGVYVCDWINHRVQVFGPEGRVVTSLYGDAQELSKWAKMMLAASPDAMKRRRE